MSLDFYLEETRPTEIFWRNITHNLSPMWRKAGVYEALYNSEGKKAGELYVTLEKGLHHMTYHAEEYRALNPSNGWGNYEGALAFLKDVMDACNENPGAIVRISK